MNLTSAVQQPRKVLRISQLAEKFGIGISTAWRNVKHNPDWPRPFKLGPRTTVFYEDEADAYLAKCAAQRMCDAVGEIS